MNDLYFYLSYSRLDFELDGDNAINRFFHDLDGQLRLRLGISSSYNGFLDMSAIDSRDNWDQTVNEALNTCRTFVSLYSRSYFNSEYCGKEWQFFSMRLNQFKADSSTENQYAPLILPIAWSAPENFLSKLPPVAANIQFMHGSYPEEYQENGLYYLLRRASLKECYYDFLDKFSSNLIKAAENYILPPLKTIPALSSVPNAFAAHSSENAEEPRSKSFKSARHQLTEQASRAASQNKPSNIVNSKSADVFLSYSSVDRERVRFIVEALEGEGFSVWWDRNIRAGKNFSRVIREKLDAAKCVVVVWSNASVQSNWVEAEASRANKRHILVPALIDSVEDEIPLEFSLIQTAQLNDSSGRLVESELRNLLDSVRELLELN